MVLSAILVVLLLFLLVTRYYDDALYRKAAVLSLSGHVITTLVLIPRLSYSWDIGAFHTTAIEIAAGTVPGSSTSVTSFATVQALVYTLFTPQPQTIGLFNGLFAVLTVIPAMYIASSLYPRVEQDTPAVMLLVLFMPVQFLILSIPMRDALSVILFFTLLATLTRVIRTGNLQRGLRAIPLWAMLFLLRVELAMITVLGVLMVLCIGFLRVLDAELSVPSLLVLFGGVGSLGVGLFSELLYSFDRVNSALQSRSTGGAVYLDGMSYGSWFDFLIASPARGFYFQFAPFPLHVGSMFHLLALLGTVPIIVLAVSAVRSLSECKTDTAVAMLLVVVYITGIVGYGTINSNFGTNVRHRIAFDYLLIVFASPVLHQWWLRLRVWVGVVPSEDGEDYKQQQEAQELHRGA